MSVAKAVFWGAGGAARLHAGRLPAAARGASRRCGDARRGAGRSAPSRTSRSSSPRTRGRGHRARRSPTRSRSTSPRERLRGHRRLRRLARRHRRRGARAAGADVVLELPRGGKIRRAGRGRRSGATRRSIVSRSPTPTRAGSPTRCGELVARVRRPAGRLRLRAGPLRRRRATAPTRRASTGATRCGCARSSRGSASVTARQRRDLRGAPRGLHRRRPGAWATTSRSRSTWSSAGWRAVYAPAARATREDGALDRGRVRAQAADDEPRLADRPARRHALAARLPAALRADDRLAPACCATRRRCCTSSLLAANLALLGEGAVYVVALALQLALLARGAARRPRPLAPLLVARYYVLTTAVGRRPACGTGCATARPRAGRRRRARDEARRSTLARRAAPRCWSDLAAAARSRSLAIRLESRGGAIYRQRRVGRGGREFDVIKLRTMVSGAESHGRGPRDQRERHAHHARRRLLRRTSLDELPNLVNVLRGEMAIVGPRPTRARAGRAVHRAPARPARGAAGHHRLGAGQRPHRAALGRAHRARPLVHRAPLAAARRR